ncbi:acylphosphatase [Balneola sp. MJW-20]|uniref:acylphosphatase n=1 Tax=Gracilimonas aurantiaca TaxID=3234185 RepID=UPI00346713E8
MTGITSIQLIIDGRVQGVGFRNFTRRKARSLGIKGWVRNLNDGRVEVQAQGDENAIRQFIDQLHEGPPASYVKKIDRQEIHSDSDLGPFSVRY